MIKHLLLLTAVATQAMLAQASSYTTLYSFQGGTDGSQPIGGVILDKAGALYGTTYGGGAFSSGTVFRLTFAGQTPWTETVLHSFNGSDGSQPTAGLAVGSGGAFYGVTLSGGGNGSGVIFQLTPP